MLKGEIEILAAIALNKRTAKQIKSCRIARYSSYINSTINSLIRRGYISTDRFKEYQLTEKGSRAFIEFCPDHSTLSKLAHVRLLHEHTDKVGEAIKLIENLGIEYNIKLNGIQNQQLS